MDAPNCHGLGVEQAIVEDTVLNNPMLGVSVRFIERLHGHSLTKVIV